MVAPTAGYAQQVGMVLEAALIEGDGFLGNVESAVAQTFFHVHKPLERWPDAWP